MDKEAYGSRNFDKYSGSTVDVKRHTEIRKVAMRVINVRMNNALGI